MKKIIEIPGSWYWEDEQARKEILKEIDQKIEALFRETSGELLVTIEINT